MFILFLVVVVSAVIGGALIYRKNKNAVDAAETKIKNVLDVLKK